MGRSSKKKKGFSRAEYRHTLEKFQKILEDVTSQEEFEKIKQGLIKLYEKVKNYPELLDLEEERIEIFKACNLNLQFLNMDEDVWQFFSRGKIEDAYNLVINGVGTMNALPDRHLLQDWVRDRLQHSLGKIAEIVNTKEKAEENKSANQVTLENQELNAIHSFPNKDPLTPNVDGPTVMQKSPPTIPFARSEVKANQIERNTHNPSANNLNATILPHKSEKTRMLSQTDEFDTLFKPKGVPDIEQVNTTMNPFEKSDRTVDENPIHTYWVRNTNIKQNIVEDEQGLSKDKKKNAT